MLGGMRRIEGGLAVDMVLDEAILDSWGAWTAGDGEASHGSYNQLSKYVYN